MAWVSASSFLRRFVARPKARERDDPADMGTAFGLEASLGPVSAYPAEADDQAHGAAGDASPMGWLARRLTRPR